MSLSSDFGGDPSNRNLYATSLPNNAPYGTNPFAAGSFDADSGAPRNDLTGNSSPAIENSLRLRESSSTNARLVRRPNPYNYIPSLYDMYLQATPHPATLERFGMQVFQNGTRDLQSFLWIFPSGRTMCSALAMRSRSICGEEFRDVSMRLSIAKAASVCRKIGPVLVAGKSLADVQQSVQKNSAHAVPRCFRRRFAGAIAHHSRLCGRRCPASPAPMTSARSRLRSTRCSRPEAPRLAAPCAS